MPEAPRITWGEPFVVSAEDGSYECEVSTGADPADYCGRPSRWYVEAVGATGPTIDVPSFTDGDGGPELHACDDHLVEALNGLIGDGGDGGR